MRFSPRGTSIPGKSVRTSRSGEDGSRGNGFGLRHRGLTLVAGDGREHRYRIDRLGDMVVHSRIQKPLAFLDGGMGGHRNNRQFGESRIGADTGRRLMAVHYGHLQVHKHNVIGPSTQQSECGPSGKNTCPSLFCSEKVRYAGSCSNTSNIIILNGTTRVRATFSSSLLQTYRKVSRAGPFAVAIRLGGLLKFYSRARVIL